MTNRSTLLKRTEVGSGSLQTLERYVFDPVKVRAYCDNNGTMVTEAS